MIDDDALEILVSRQIAKECQVGQAWFESCRHRYDAGTYVDAVRSYSEEALHPLIKLSQEIFDIYWESNLIFVAMPSPTVSAYAERIEGHFVVVVHQGLLDLLRLWAVRMILTEAVLTSEEFEGQSADAAKTLIECCYGLSLALCDRPIRIPNLHLRLADEDKRQVFQIYVGALSFVLAHEISHHRLGHTEAIKDFASLRARSGSHLLINEHVVFTKQREFEADLSALDCARAERPAFFAAAQVFLENLALIQSVHGNRFASHPLAANRLGALRSGLRPDTLDHVAELYDRADELAAKHVELAELTRDEVVAAFEVDVPRATSALEAIVAQLYGTRFKDEFVRNLLRDQVEDVPDLDVRGELLDYVEGLSPIEVQSTAVATIVAIVENYFNFISLGRTPSEAISEIDALRALHNGRSAELRQDLGGYVRARLSVDHPDAGLAEERISEFIARTRHFYSW